MDIKNKKIQKILFINIGFVLLIFSVIGVFLLKNHPTMAVETIGEVISVEPIRLTRDPFRPLGNDSGVDQFVVHGIPGTNIPVYCYNSELGVMNTTLTMKY